jgi:hypothetical protein
MSDQNDARVRRETIIDALFDVIAKHKMPPDEALYMFGVVARSAVETLHRRGHGDYVELQKELLEHFAKGLRRRTSQPEKEKTH